MTALKEFQRLEATALWRPGPEAQRREVIVALGDATLTVSTTAGEILTHWSIAAVTRANPGKTPAIYHPENDPEETLELAEDEAQMITGLDRVLRAIDRRRPKPGKLRLILTGGFVAALVAMVVFWLPDALVRYATTVVPQVKRDEIGARVLDAVTRLTGQACTSPDARLPLERLSARVQEEGRIVILPDGAFASVHLPGRIILLNRRILEDHEDPDVAAGYALAEATRARASDPLAELLDYAGLFSTLRLLTTGYLPEDALSAYAEAIMTRPPARPDAAELLPAFAAAELRSTPYAYAMDMTGETTLPLIEADPMRGGPSRLVLSDADWVRLQGICGN